MSVHACARVRCSRPLGLLFLCFVFVLVLTPSVASQDDDTAVDRQLSLQIDAPKGEFAAGDEALVSLTATNAGKVLVEAATLHLHDQPGMEWSEDFKDTWLELGDLPPGESRVIEGRVWVTGLPAGGMLSLFATLHGYDTPPAEASAQLTAPPPPLEEVTVAKQGSLVDAAGGRVQFAFPADWHESDAQLTFQLQEQLPQAAGETGRLLLFSVEATAGDSAIDSFDAAATVTVDLNGMVDPAWAAERPPVVSTRETEKENWTAVESAFDPKTGILTFATTHFSSYQVTTEPELWRLSYNPPGASPYTGAATYQYPIELPPGIGGLTPDLTLAYGSRSVDGLRYPVMSQGFGAGWSLPQAQINSGNAGNFYSDDAAGNQNNGDYDASSFTLVLNGQNYYLNPLDTSDRYGTFKAIGAPDIYIEYVADGGGENNTDNVSGEFWRVKTADGTTYTFGQTEDAEQVNWPMQVTRNDGQPRNKSFAPYNWKLNRIVDVHGNKIEYVYETSCGLVWVDDPKTEGPDYREAGIDGGGEECTEVDTAVKEIHYNFNSAMAQTKVFFTNSQMNYNQRRQEKSMTAGVFRPSRIESKQGGTLISRYDFGYVSGEHQYPDWAVGVEFWMLTSISRFGANGTAALPTQTFTYSRDTMYGCHAGACVRLLTEVANGYGAVTVLNYAKWNSSRWQHVTQTETWDGVLYKKGREDQGQTRTVYDRTGATPCFDTAGSGCTMGGPPRSEALVGFDKVTIDTQKPAGGAWTTVARTKTEFINANYLLIGKTSKQQQLEPDNSTVLTEDTYTWGVGHTADGELLLAQLMNETHTLLSLVSSSVVYTYEDLNPAGEKYGALAKKEEKDEAGNLFRCTTYAYAHRTSDTWLINRPIRETLYEATEGACPAANKRAETLYRYAGSTKPTITGLDTRGLLSYVMHWVSGTKYVLEKRTYEANGAPQAFIAYSGLIGSGANNYTLNEHNRTTYYYTNNTLGRPTQIMHSGVDAKTGNQWLTYNTSFYWLVGSVSDSNQTVTQYGYDTFGRLERVALPGDSLDPGNQTITYAYADGVAPWKVETSYKNSIRSAERVYYDGLGRPVQTQTDNASVYVNGVSSDKDLVKTLAYDARGLEVCRTVPFSVGAGANVFDSTACSAKANTTTAYDTLGRPTSVMTPDEVVSSMTYGVTIDVTVTGHSIFLRTAAIDGNGHKVERYNDVFGRLVLVREFTGNSTATHTAFADTRYSYDVLDNLTAVGTSEADNPPVNFLRLTTMTYDALGRKLTMTDPDMGAWNYQYDPAGNLIRQQDPNNVLCFRYDGLNRLRQRYLDGKPGASCDTAGPSELDTILADYVYGSSSDDHNIGRLVAVSWGWNPDNNNDAFTYDAEGRLSKQTRKVNNQTFEYEVVAYDTLDRPTQVELPGGEVITTTYDEEGANSLSAGSTSLIDNTGYNERGQLAFLGRPGNAPDTTLSYHDAMENFRLSAITNSGSSSLPDFTYNGGINNGYDNAGNLTAFGDGSHSYTYTYDEQNRLQEVEGSIYRKYEYDLLGNFDKVTKGSTLWDYSYAAGNPSRLMSVTNLPMTVNATQGYDSLGNLWKYTKSGIAYELTFDVENRLQSVKVGTGTPTTFEYDANGQRVLTTIGTGTSQVKIYTPFPDYEKEIPTSGATTIRTTYRLGGQIVAVQTKVGPAAGTFYFTYTDHLGNVAALSWTGGTLVPGSLASYDPFGTLTTTPSTNPPITNHGFTGHRHNNTGSNDLGLIYMNARYYMPQIGRFISPDSIVPNPLNPQSLNRYSYVLNSPLNFSDPSGHRECNQQTLDCSNPIPHPTMGALVTFAGDWAEDEKVTFTSGSEQTAQAWFEVAGYEYHTPREVFLAVFGNPVLVEKVDMNCATAFNEPTWDCYGSAAGDTVTVYSDAQGNIAENEMWAMHEIFHAFNANAGGQPYIDLENHPIVVNGETISPSGGSRRSLQGYQMGIDYATDRTPYVNSWDDFSVGEDFADMGTNWVAGSFAADEYGAARFRWMDIRMRGWLSLAVSQN